MNQGKLTVTFHGVCTHFRNVVPGVPHRVVLPDASSVRGNAITIAGPEADMLATEYMLMPHTVSFEPALVPALAAADDIAPPFRLQVANAIDRDYKAENDHHRPQLPKLTSYVSDYQISNDVVFRGRAACYFDIFVGHVTTVVEKDSAICVQATFTTNGPPQLLVTPFFGPPAPTVIEFKEHTAHLTIRNKGKCITGEEQFDFLLHYHTSLNGIPKVLVRPTPGMNLYKNLETSAACSNSTYP